MYHRPRQILRLIEGALISLVLGAIFARGMPDTVGALVFLGFYQAGLLEEFHID